MTQAQKQALIAATAAAARAFSDLYDPQTSMMPAEFFAAWEKAWEAHQASLVLCPSCDTEDPGNPPPPN